MTTVQFVILGIYALMFVVFLVVALFFRYRYRFLKGRLRVRVLSDTGKEKSIIKKMDAQDGEKFDLEVFGKLRTFEIDRASIIFTGPEEMPTLEYNADDAVPVLKPFKKNAAERLVSSVRFREVAGNTIMRDLLESFRKKFITSELALIITVGAILLSTLILGVFMNDKIGKIEERLPAPQVNTGVPIE